MTYTFQYKRGFFWKTLRKAKGHNYQTDSDRMDVYFGDKIIWLSKWSECDQKLGADFILFQKENMETESGQNIKIKEV